MCSCWEIEDFEAQRPARPKLDPERPFAKIANCDAASLVRFVDRDLREALVNIGCTQKAICT